MTEALTSAAVTDVPAGTVPADNAAPAQGFAAVPDPAAVPGTATETEAAVHAIADRSRHAARRMARANRAWKDRGLRAIGKALVEHKHQILAANAKDVAAGRAAGTSAALLDRLTLTDSRIDGPRRRPGKPRHPAGSRRQRRARPDPPQRAAPAPDQRTHGRGGRDLRGPPERHGRHRRTGPQERQRRHPARRIRRRCHQRRPDHHPPGCAGIGGPARRRRPDRGPIRPRRRQRAHAGARPGGRAHSPRRPRADPDRRDELLRAGHRDR